MNRLSNLPSIVSRRKKRLGRGTASGKGAKSSRGTKRHQKARENISLWFEGGQNRMVKKFPLLRGKAKNKSVREPAIPINLKNLNDLPEGKTVDMDFLVKNNIVSEENRKAKVKILSAGKLTKKLKIALPISKKAAEKVIEAGGQIVSNKKA